MEPRGARPKGRPPRSTSPAMREQVRQVVRSWAPAFARGDEGASEHMPSADAVYAAGTNPWKRSFAEAEIKRITIHDEALAIVGLSNENRVLLARRNERWQILDVG
jgi:hypothetical protein